MKSHNVQCIGSQGPLNQSCLARAKGQIINWFKFTEMIVFATVLCPFLRCMGWIVSRCVPLLHQSVRGARVLVKEQGFRSWGEFPPELLNGVKLMLKKTFMAQSQLWACSFAPLGFPCRNTQSFAMAVKLPPENHQILQDWKKKNSEGCKLQMKEERKKICHQKGLIFMRMRACQLSGVLMLVCWQRWTFCNGPGVPRASTALSWGAQGSN